jgi:HK97 family phage major capsid protein
MTSSIDSFGSKLFSEIVQERRDAAARSLDSIKLKMTVANASEARSMKVTMAAEEENIARFDERIIELKEQEQREACAVAAYIPPLGTDTRALGFTGREEEVYRPDRTDSFFKDMRAARLGDWGASERLSRNNAMRSRETRAGDMTTVGGAGGQFAPPLWLTEEWIALARPGRVTADLFQKQPLPAGVSSINLPKVATGSATSVQAVQNTAIQDTALTTGSVSSGITTIAGQQVVSLQLIQQSGVAFDRVILGDLAADHARMLDVQVISGSGTGGNLRGLLNGAGVGATTFTTATPKVTDGTTPANSFYNKVVSAVNSIATARYLPATAIVMHPSRWAWVLEALDASGRPIILTNGGAFNALGVSGEPIAEGAAGNMLGLPVYTDPSIPTNLGVGTNQDPVLVVRAPDLFLWETDLALQSFDATYASQLSVLYRASSYSAAIPDRFGPSVNVILGTGMIGATL